jgi:hypothetical protein
MINTNSELGLQKQKDVANRLALYFDISFISNRLMQRKTEPTKVMIVNFV